MSETTGKIPFTHDGVTYETWYKVVGDLSTKNRPLVTLHGGPGISHHYMLPHTSFATSHHTPVIFYDQIGIGQSSHLKNVPPEFWTIELFMDELDNLLIYLGIRDDFDLVGHSWGAMLGAHYAAYRRPAGLKHLILVSGSASMKLWAEGTNRLLDGMPEDLREMLKKHEREGTTDSKEYHDGTQIFYNKHVCPLVPWPELLLKSFGNMFEDPTVYSTMIGPSEFNITGSLRTWSVVDKLHDITSPTLVINGQDDEAHDVGNWPFFTQIPRVKWVKFAQSAHMTFFEEPERYKEVVGEFLTNV
ncbi:hypothetical protein IEO21_03749 [Rhodonia placenta]|uniref:AB hydrolase-1 domain-containing protein n=1 Tax=Rhodonia placenta TaxID=104341 RepID=A0A8H7P581_9APHY|nr:hypothetical protein IEO21_03749 [Postia placenta]